MEATRDMQDVDTMALVANANQKVLEVTLSLATGTAAEGLRLYAELQSSAVDAARVGRDFWLRRLNEVQEWQKDPLAWYQKALAEGTEESRKVFEKTQDNARTLTRSTERLQATVEQAGEKIQKTVNDLAAEVRALYQPPPD